MILKFNKKGQVEILVCILVIVVLIALLWIKFVKPMQNERDHCISKLGEISNLYEQTKQKCSIEIQKLINENAELKEMNTNLTLRLESYEKLKIPFTDIELNNWLGLILLSASLIILLAVAKLKIKIERTDSNFLKIIIGILIILNIISLSLKIYSLIINLF